MGADGAVSNGGGRPTLPPPGMEAAQRVARFNAGVGGIPRASGGA